MAAAVASGAVAQVGVAKVSVQVVGAASACAAGCWRVKARGLGRGASGVVLARRR